MFLYSDHDLHKYRTTMSVTTQWTYGCELKVVWPPDDGLSRQTETYVGESYMLLLKFDSEVAFVGLIYSEL